MVAPVNDVFSNRFNASGLLQRSSALASIAVCIGDAGEKHAKSDGFGPRRGIAPMRTAGGSAP
ncbi:hypothetical protein PoMZ_09328 [Pyricularia oryzae]|uniref:Uncharacterized protein n=1 Tax=Pyricularia oryzae TaxID=318829 RepID=A0A4P7N1D8_PYROR|nr:hypothetical protein PoMZ_09328 [Pyricularia oryzae]